MTTTCPAAQELRESPFFILNGPQGRALACQWTMWSDVRGRAMSDEFEIVCPETPESMGTLFGLFQDGEFRMRPTDGGLDPDWRGTVDDVADLGCDLDMGPDGLLVIGDPDGPSEGPYADRPVPVAAEAMAAL